MTPQHLITDSETGFATQAVEFLSEQITRTIAERGSCSLGLSGGSTPGPVYEQLARVSGIDWEKVSLFLIDERYVPPEHAESNQRLIYQTLLNHVAIPDEQCVLPDTRLQLNECVLQYEAALDQLLKHEGADLVVLGLGEDGHIASLFPPLPEEAFGPSQVIHTTTDRFAVNHRISVTLPFLERASARLFLLKGQKKLALWEKFSEAKMDPAKWPAQALLDDRTTLITAQ